MYSQPFSRFLLFQLKFNDNIYIVPPQFWQDWQPINDGREDIEVLAAQSFS